MSTKLTGYVWDGCAASGMKLSSVAIMARLADFSNDEGVCWPSIETIARQIGAGMSTVRTAIARLEAEGWLTRKARRQGMGDQQRQRYQVQLSLRQKYQQQLEQLRRDSEQKGTYNTDDYRKAEQALTESLNRQLNENRRYWQQLEVVQGNWKNGVLRAFQDFTVDADNTAGTAEQVFSSAFSNMGNGLATFVTTGKLNFKSFTSSVLSDMAKILAQATMMKSIKGIGSVPGLCGSVQPSD